MDKSFAMTSAADNNRSHSITRALPPSGDAPQLRYGERLAQRYLGRASQDHAATLREAEALLDRCLKLPSPQREDAFLLGALGIGAEAAAAAGAETHPRKVRTSYAA